MQILKQCGWREHYGLISDSSDFQKEEEEEKGTLFNQKAEEYEV